MLPRQPSCWWKFGRSDSPKKTNKPAKTRRAKAKRKKKHELSLTQNEFWPTKGPSPITGRH